MKSQSFLLILILSLPSCEQEDTAPIKTDNSQSKNQQYKHADHRVPKKLTQLSTEQEPTKEDTAQTLAEIRSKRLSPDFESASTQFGEFLKTLGVVGKPIKEVRNQLGAPDRETPNSIGYIFENGFFGKQWVLKHDGQKVISFHLESVN